MWRSDAVRGGLAVLCVVATLGATGADRRIVEAAKARDLSAVRALLRQKAPVNAAEPDGTTALHWAVRADDLPLIQTLVTSGANVNAANRYGVTPLALAAVNGSVSAVSTLLKAGASPQSTNGEGEPVLMTAARTGNVDVVNMLIAAGADVNAREAWENETALMWAAGDDHADVVATLAAHGADVNARSKLFDYPKVKVDIATMAVTAVPKGNLTALLFAARQGAAHAASALINAGADLNAADPDGTTPVVLAIINAHYDVAKVLVDAGADLSLADASGMGPLYAAVDMLHQEPLLNRPFRQPTGSVSAHDLIRVLLDRGANPNAKLKSPLMIRQHNGGDPLLGDGATPLMRAAKVSDVELMRLLLDKGADAKSAMKNGTTALMIAASRAARPAPPESQTVAALTLLQEHGADPNAVNASGETALHLAVGHGDQVVSYLAAHGASVDAKDSFGRTPLDVALGVPGGARGRGAAAAAEKPPVYEATAALLRKLMAARTQ